jgi:hypothetical protein
VSGRRIVTLLLLVALVLGVSGPARADFQIVCFLSHRLADDPIVLPGQPGASHGHDFFANVSTNASSTYEDMILARTNCRLADDTAGYWIPTLLKSGTPVDIRRVNVYYRTGPGVDPASVVAFPPDFRVVAGGNTTLEPMVAFYSCGTGAPRTSVPGDCGTRPVRAHIHFPNCWDGVNLDSANHRSHLEYGKAKTGCPASHPLPVPMIALQVVYRLRDGTRTTLSSGNTTTLHADFWNTWDQAGLEAAVATCVTSGQQCGELRD